MANRLELISFKICPFVQRSVILLKHKRIPHEITYIELGEPPEWFDRISPMGKVPVLRVTAPGASEPTVLFESAVINEYLDEVNPPRLLPADPLERARERAWIEFGSELLGTSFGLMSESDATKIPELNRELFEELAKLTSALSPEGPFFRGREPSLADCAFAPVFTRLALLQKLAGDPAWKAIPRVRAWSDALCAWPAVRESVVPEFESLMLGYLRERGAALV
jgi:glutathione S-transferase